MRLLSALWRVVRRLDLLSYHLVSRGLILLALSVLVGAGHDALPACAEVHLRTCAVCRSGVLAVPVRVVFGSSVVLIDVPTSSVASRVSGIAGVE